MYRVTLWRVKDPVHVFQPERHIKLATLWTKTSPVFWQPDVEQIVHQPSGLSQAYMSKDVYTLWDDSRPNDQPLPASSFSTGAERYLEERLEDGKYRDAYDAAQEDLTGPNVIKGGERLYWHTDDGEE